MDNSILETRDQPGIKPFPFVEGVGGGMLQVKRNTTIAAFKWLARPYFFLPTHTFSLLIRVCTGCFNAMKIVDKNFC